MRIENKTEQRVSMSMTTVTRGEGDEKKREKARERETVKKQRNETPRRIAQQQLQPPRLGGTWAQAAPPCRHSSAEQAGAKSSAAAGGDNEAARGETKAAAVRRLVVGVRTVSSASHKGHAAVEAQGRSHGSGAEGRVKLGRRSGWDRTRDNCGRCTSRAAAR